MYARITRYAIITICDTKAAIAACFCFFVFLFLLDLDVLMFVLFVCQIVDFVLPFTA